MGKLKEGVQSEDLSVNGRIIFNCILNKEAGSVWTDFIWSSIGQVAGCCEHGHEHGHKAPRSVKDGEFLRLADEVSASREKGNIDCKP